MHRNRGPKGAPRSARTASPGRVRRARHAATAVRASRPAPESRDGSRRATLVVSDGRVCVPGTGTTAPADGYGLGRGGGLRAAASARCRAAGHVGGAVIAEVCLLRAAAGVRICQAQRGALSLADFLTAVVAYEHSLAGQVDPSYFGLIKRRS